MSLLTSIFNKIQYQLTKASVDPEAEAFAKAQAQQAKQDAELASRKSKQEANTLAAEKAKKEAEVAAINLSARSRFDIPKLIRDSSSSILYTFIGLAVLMFMMYGGHLAANHDIGYSPIGRIMSFFYGSLLSPILIIKALYEIYWKEIKLNNYAFLPITTYVPRTDLEKFFLYPFVYTEDSESTAARARVAQSYLEAFQRTEPFAKVLFIKESKQE
jgi:hypothetical protein